MKQAIFRTTRRDKPSLRVRCVMRRISRDTWLSPKEVERIGAHLTRKACAGLNLENVYRAGIPMCCEGVGMIRGEPPAQLYEPHYRQVLDVVKRYTGKNREEVMINLLKIARKA